MTSCQWPAEFIRPSELAADIALVGVPSDDVASVILEAISPPRGVCQARGGGKREAKRSLTCAFFWSAYSRQPRDRNRLRTRYLRRGGPRCGTPRVRKLACAQLGRALRSRRRPKVQLPFQKSSSLSSPTSSVDSTRGRCRRRRDRAPPPRSLQLPAETLNSSFRVSLLRRRPTLQRPAYALTPSHRSWHPRPSVPPPRWPNEVSVDEPMREVDDRRDPLAVMAAMELLAEPVEQTRETSNALVSTRFSQPHHCLRWHRW